MCLRRAIFSWYVNSVPQEHRDSSMVLMDRFPFRLALVYLIGGHFVNQGHYSLVNVSLLLLTKKASFIFSLF